MRLFLVVFCTSCIALSGCERSKKLPFEVGVFSSVVNPPIGTFIAGDRQNRRFTGITDSLFAKCAIISDTKNTVALVTIDCIGLMYPDLLKIREEVAKQQFPIPFSVENIVISSTHTHAGPDVVGIWGKDFSQSGVNPEYMQFLIKTVAKGIKNALHQRQPAYAQYIETSFGEDWVANICNEEIDRSVNCLIFKGKRDNLILSMTNFACHPTFLDAVQSEVSADYLATFYKKMGANLGGEHLFLQGAIGGWIQPIKGKGKKSEAYKMGNEFAEAVIFALKKPTDLKGDVINFKSKKVTLKVDNEAWKQLSTNGLIDRKVGDTIESEMALFAIGEAQFVTHPGETAPFYALKTKEMLTGNPKFILGLSQDALGYILKPSYYSDSTLPHAEYMTRTSLGKDTGPLILQTIKELRDDSKP